ncbi:MAG TPA: RDD family protein [Beijerinckiaceae bacterium]|nr:RDD family protein [Beijerinckiaceae bacterium]
MANGPFRSDPYARPPSMPPAGGWAPAVSTDGVLSRRLFGYLVDLIMIGLLALVLSIFIGFIGLLTLGLGWSLFAILPFTGILYSAITLGGSKQSTVGMRLMGVRGLDAISGGPVGHLRAAVHALLFYVAATTFLLWVVDVIIGMARSDRRMGHDLLVGLAFVRSS